MKIPIGNLYQDFRFKGKFKIKIDNKPVYLFHYVDTTIENEIFWKGIDAGWEKESIRIWRELCKFSNVIIDIGANTGIYSLIASAINPNSKIYSFEPCEKIYKRLVYNCSLNQFNNITCRREAISNHNGEATLFDVEGEVPYSASLNINMLDNNHKKTEVTVHTETLENFINTNNIL
ncbi:MAG: FkbM family methyltransferase [Bacteroidia bacterium]|nr:FkbM family methyltransferase [Bacteroidia bacterium]